MADLPKNFESMSLAERCRFMLARGVDAINIAPAATPASWVPAVRGIGAMSIGQYETQAIAVRMGIDFLRGQAGDFNPFTAGIYDGHRTYYTGTEDRLNAVKSFTREQCEAGLKIPELQVTVAAALQARLRKLAKGQTK